jgi:hypothetical protein
VTLIDVPFTDTVTRPALASDTEANGEMSPAGDVSAAELPVITMPVTVAPPLAGAGAGFPAAACVDGATGDVVVLFLEHAADIVAIATSTTGTATILRIIFGLSCYTFVMGQRQRSTPGGRTWRVRPEQYACPRRSDALWRKVSDSE